MKTLTEQLATIKNTTAGEIKNLDTAENVNVFQFGKGWFQFDLTKNGKVVSGSVKYMYPIENYNNCSY